jgi:hypothetical protein
MYEKCENDCILKKIVKLCLNDMPLETYKGYGIYTERGILAKNILNLMEIEE